MIEIKNKQFVMDGEAKLILAGEIHYFRLEKKDWQDRITKLKDAGFNAVATYIPWICHEEAEGEFDFDGSTREELDLIGFLELCQKNDLYFIARPGPFLMAEMKNEGIPFWVAEKYPDIIPVTWDGRKVESATLDYLNKDYLSSVKRWYEKVMPILAERLYDKGGNVIGVQLDNEIGMLSWCSNAPDLTEVVLSDLKEWLHQQYQEAELTRRYPFASLGMREFTKSVQSPKEEYVMELHKDLGHFMRRRYTKYVEILTGYAKEYGMVGVPYLINIHGTSMGRGLTYPIGISQLYESYNISDEYLAGSDIYLGTLDMNNFQDLYIANAYMEAVNRENQPLASFEFECGDADYGETKGGRTDVSAADFKTRMCIAQGNRLLNCYLFCGGRNYELKYKRNDGNDRIAFTGERHGFAAPVSPEGELNYTYERMALAMKTMGANEDKLAAMEEERDNVALGFIPDYYMTEYCYPTSSKESELTRELTQFRGAAGFERIARAMLLDNYRFTAQNIQDKEIDSEKVQTLVIFSASYMAEHIQKKLSDFVTAGGNILLYGLLPEKDMEGKSCTILKDLLGIKKTAYAKAGARYHLSTTPEGYLKGAEVRCGYAQTYEIEDATVLMRTSDTKEICGFEKNAGKGRILVMGTEYICHLENIQKMLSSLGSTPSLSNDSTYHGLFLTVTKNYKEERFLHILNLDGFSKTTGITYQGQKLFEGEKLVLASKEGRMLPMNMTVEGGVILWSTAEVAKRSKESITLRLGQPQDRIVWQGTGIIREAAGYRVEEQDGRTIVVSTQDGRVMPELTLYYK